VTLSPADRVRRGRVRRAIATVIIVAWAASIGGLVRRDVIRTPAQRLAEMAARVNPGNVFYTVDRDGRRYGWASFTIDTLADSVLKKSDTLSFLDEMVVEMGSGAQTERVAERMQVMLSRAFVLRRFAFDLDSGGVYTRTSGNLAGDSSIVVVKEQAGRPADTQRVAVTPPVLLPTVLPLAAVLRGTPKAGSHATYHTFDPRSLRSGDATVEIVAESLFTVDDSASMDVESGRWRSALRDTIRAWRVRASGAATFDGWIDAEGRPVAATRGDYAMRRMAYELSFENWRLDRKVARGAGAEFEVSDRSLIESGVPRADGPPQEMRVRMTAPSLRSFALESHRQTAEGNLVTVRAESDRDLTAAYTLPPTTPFRSVHAAELKAEPYIQTRVPVMLRAAMTIIRHERDPRALAEVLVKWVADSIARVATDATPDAVGTLTQRRGDVAHKAVLFAALARSLDIPTRVVSGVVHANGRFQYHVWNEVFLGTWVAVDPTLRQFPADAGHLQLLTGGAERRSELSRLLSTLHIEVLERR
jgi:transglutaminase-like putative cysteine protease